MSFTFNCPFCKQQLEAEDEWIGQEADCPSCGAKIIVPDPSEMKNDDSESSKATLESARMEEKDICTPSDNSETKEKTSTIENENSNASEKQIEKENDSGWVWTLVALAVIALLFWLAWLFVTGLPRLAFWLIAPIIGIVILCYAKKLNKVVISILCCIIFLWGWWAHTRHTDSSEMHSVSSEMHSGSSEMHSGSSEGKQTNTCVNFACFFVNKKGQKRNHDATINIVKGEHKIYQSFVNALNAKSKYAYAQRNARNAKASSSYDAFDGDGVFKEIDAGVNSVNARLEYNSSLRSFLSDLHDFGDIVFSDLSFTFNGNSVYIPNVPISCDIPQNTTITILVQAQQGDIVCWWCRIINTGNHKEIDMIFDTNHDCLIP